MARRQTPPEWQALLDKAGISSLNRLAELAKLSTTTVTRTVHRDHQPASETVAALATVLRVPEKSIYRLTHGRDIAIRQWVPPAEVQRLSRREQDALTEMIRAMAASHDQEEVTGNDNPAPMTQAGEEPPAHDELQARRDRPHRRRRAGNDPEWDDLYGHKEAASEGIPGEKIGQDHTDSP